MLVSQAALDGLLAGQVGGGGEVDAVVVEIGAQRVGDLAVAELDQRLAFPGFALAAVLFQPDRRQPLRQPAQQAAGVDRGQLAVVADQHDLRPRLRRVLQQHRELAGADHAGLIDHQDVVAAERIVVELKDKITAGDAMEAMASGPEATADDIKLRDATLALISLGYKQAEALAAIKKVAEKGTAGTVEDMVRKYPDQWFWIHQRWKTKPWQGA